jgi:hypothetical protein
VDDVCAVAGHVFSLSRACVVAVVHLASLVIVVERDLPLLNVTRPLSSLSSQLGLFSRSEVVWIHTHGEGRDPLRARSLARATRLNTTTYYYGGVLGSSRYISLAGSISAPSPRD